MNHWNGSASITQIVCNALITNRTYAAIVNSTVKRNYRADLRQDAVARASAIRKSQKPVKADKPSKLRGAKAEAAAEKA
jgi:large subunit ribosomal protein L28e